MPETNAPAPARPTLTQRRTMGPMSTSLPRMDARTTVSEVPSTPTLERPMRMAPTGATRPVAGGMGGGSNNVSRAVAPGTEEKSSPAKIVLWVVLVVAIAVASYFAIKNNMQNTSDNTPKVTVTPTEELKPSILSSDNVQADKTAVSPMADTDYNTDAQSVGTASQSTFTINSVAGTKYETFTRIVFNVENDSTASKDVSPVVSATYDPEAQALTLNFKNTATLDTVFGVDKTFTVNTKTVDTISRVASATTTDDSYVISLNKNTSYVLHLVSDEATKVVVDIKEVVATTTPTTTPSVTTKVTGTVTPTPSIKVTTTPIVGGNILENSYSTSAQTLNNGLTTNTADMVCKDKCLYWIETASGFTFEKPVSLGDGDKYPSVSASLSGTTLTVTISNLINKSASSPMTFSGSDLVKSLDAVRSGNTLTYTFTLFGTHNYRILFTKSDYLNNADVLRIQVQP